VSVRQRIDLVCTSLVVDSHALDAELSIRAAGPVYEGAYARTPKTALRRRAALHPCVYACARARARPLCGATIPSSPRAARPPLRAVRRYVSLFSRLDQSGASHVLAAVSTNDDDADWQGAGFELQ
jgi:hypothetical protein